MAVRMLEVQKVGGELVPTGAILTNLSEAAENMLVAHGKAERYTEVKTFGAQIESKSKKGGSE